MACVVEIWMDKKKIITGGDAQNILTWLFIYLFNNLFSTMLFMLKWVLQVCIVAFFIIFFSQTPLGTIRMCLHVQPLVRLNWALLHLRIKVALGKICQKIGLQQVNGWCWPQFEVCVGLFVCLFFLTRWDHPSFQPCT